MAQALYRNNETGELLELSDQHLVRWPNDPYTLVTTDERAKLEAEARQADIAALGAQPYQAGEDVPAAPAAAPAAPTRTDDDDEDPRASRRF